MMAPSLIVLLNLLAVDVGKLLERARPGQEIVLPAGLHQGIHLQDRRFDPPVTIRAAKRHEAIIDQRKDTGQAAWLQRCRGLRFDGVVFTTTDTYPLHIDGTPWPKVDLSSDIQFRRCAFIARGELYCAKLSQAKDILFDECRFLVPPAAQAKSKFGGCLDAVAVDNLTIRRCRFENPIDGAITLMIKGGARHAVVVDNEFHSAREAQFMLAGSTDPSFWTREKVKHELEDLTFARNKVYFPEPTGDDLHGVWDSLADAVFEDNEFHNVAQFLFVAKKSQARLENCANITFRRNQVYLSAKCNKTPRVIDTQYYLVGDKYFPLLEPEQFHAGDNKIFFPGPVFKTDLIVYLEKGFELIPETAK